MSMENTYVPPKVWEWDKNNGGKFASINRPVSGATHEKELPIGKHPHQLYSLGTPNGVKVTVMLEELLALGISEAEYDAHLIKIGDVVTLCHFIYSKQNRKILLICNSPTFRWIFGNKFKCPKIV